MNLSTASLKYAHCSLARRDAVARLGFRSRRAPARAMLEARTVSVKVQHCIHGYRLPLQFSPLYARPLLLPVVKVVVPSAISSRKEDDSKWRD